MTIIKEEGHQEEQAQTPVKEVALLTMVVVNPRVLPNPQVSKPVFSECSSGSRRSAIRA
jgi:hypothetical protein